MYKPSLEFAISPKTMEENEDNLFPVKISRNGKIAAHCTDKIQAETVVKRLNNTLIFLGLEPRKYNIYNIKTTKERK